MNRRHFLRTSGAVTVAAVAASPSRGAASQAESKQPRPATATLAPKIRTLKAVAAAAADGQ